MCTFVCLCVSISGRFSYCTLVPPIFSFDVRAVCTSGYVGFFFNFRAADLRSERVISMRGPYAYLSDTPMAPHISSYPLKWVACKCQYTKKWAILGIVGPTTFPQDPCEAASALEQPWLTIKQAETVLGEHGRVQLAADDCSTCGRRRCFQGDSIGAPWAVGRRREEGLGEEWGDQAQWTTTIQRPIVGSPMVHGE